VDVKRFRLSFVVLVLLSLALPLAAQDYPWPRAEGSAADSCTACLDPYTNLPTFPYAKPVAKHTGRFLDSFQTRDYQMPVRTLRANRANALTHRNRVYMIFGSSFVSYKMDTFFNERLGQPLSRMGDHLWGSPPTAYPGEQYLRFDGGFYAEQSTWETAFADGQDRLYGFDTDDRGFIYLAYSLFRWGILRDSDGAVSSVAQAPKLTSLTNLSPQRVTAFKSGTKNFVLISTFGGNDSEIWDATDPAKPVWVKRYPGNGAKEAAKTSEAGQVIAMIDKQKALRIYSPTKLLSGSGALPDADVIFTPDTEFIDVVSDGTNFWALEGPSRLTGPAYIHRYSPASPGVAGTYALTGKYLFDPAVTVGTLTSGIRFGDGYLGVWALKNGFPSPKLFKVEPSSLSEIPVASFLNSYYYFPPAGYAKPYTDNYMKILRGVQPVKHGGKLYLIFSGYGLGDVFEVQVGDGVSARVETTAYPGTPNPNTPAGVAGPVYGDLMTFSSTTTAASPFNVTWNFDNTEAGLANNVVSTTGSAVTHRFTGVTNATEIARARSIRVSSQLDPAITDSVPVTLKVPVPRFKLSGTNLLFLSPSVSSTAPIVFGDTFVDASDGTIEGHYTDWTLDGNGMRTSPGTPLPVGECGAHTLQFAAKYAPYGGSGTSITPSANAPYVASIGSFTYNVRPFVPLVELQSSSSTTLTFGDTSRISAAYATLPRTVTWTLLNASGGTIQTQTGETTFVVSKSAISAGSVVELAISIDLSGDSTSCASMSSAKAAYVLNPPDPQIVVSGCANIGSPCSFEATSIAGLDQTPWTYQWSVGGTAIAGATSKTWDAKNYFTAKAAGTYSVSVAATNPIGNGTAATSVTLEPSACLLAATSVTINVDCNECQPAVPITFSPYAWQPSGYKFQDCDQFEWDFGAHGGIKTEMNPVVTFATAGTYTVKLKVYNINNPGGATSERSITVGTVVTPPPTPPPGCPAPGGTVIPNFSGSPTATCSSSIVGPECTVSTQVRFTASAFGYILNPSCDTYTWEFGDGRTATGATPTHTYTSTGTRTVRLTITTSGGSRSGTKTLTVIPGSAPPPCPTSAPGTFGSISYLGVESNCSATEGSPPCRANEVISFNLSTFGYTIQSCDTVMWDFDDGGTASGANVSHSFNGAKGFYTVKATISNTMGSRSFERVVSFTTAGATPVTNAAITTSGTAVFGVPVTLTGSADSDAAITQWIWNFGDGSTGSGKSIQHVYATPGIYNVGLTVRNDAGGSAFASRQVQVMDATQFAFLLPVAARQDGQFDSKWRTDLHVYMTDPSFDALAGIELTFEFPGWGQTVKKTISRSTLVQEDVLGWLMGEAYAGSGAVIVRGFAATPPQIWTRTYTVASNGIGTFGQLIPAIQLGTTASSDSGVEHYLMGLHDSNLAGAPFRTNLGLVNASTTRANFTIRAFGENGQTIGTHAESVDPYQLKQFRVGPAIPLLNDGRLFGLEIKSDQPGMMAYASFIDNVSNDPVFELAVPRTALASETLRQQIIPASHLTNNQWRTDLTIFNPDDGAAVVDLEFYDQAGTLKSSARNMSVEGNSTLAFRDVLWHGVLTPNEMADANGTLRLTTTSATTLYPVVFSRTYSDRGASGTFGQGIPGVPTALPNVTPARQGVVAGVRGRLASYDPYYSNFGLISLSDEPTQVEVILLDSVSGIAIGQMSYTLQPRQSLIQPDILATLHATAERGTIKIRVVSGGGVWAFASIVDKVTKDPEYVPAVMLQ
jgi:PKD repeat protein